MTLDPKTVSDFARRQGINEDDFSALLQTGEAVTYPAGEYLYHESSPRLWLGIVLEGEVEIIRGSNARTVTIATLVNGALISEGTILDDTPHAGSAVTRRGAVVWQIPKQALDLTRVE